MSAEKCFCVPERGGRGAVRGDVVRQRGERVLHTGGGGRPVADAQAGENSGDWLGCDVLPGIEYKVCRTGLQARLAVLTFVILPAVARVGVQLRDRSNIIVTLTTASTPQLGCHYDVIIEWFLI